MVKIKQTRFSVNLNKAALIRNSRGSLAAPSLQSLAINAISAGCKGITLHPRSDKRHATIEDVEELSKLDAVKDNCVEINVEGDLRTELIDAITRCVVHQFTIVPVREGEKTTERGWNEDDDNVTLNRVIRSLKNKLRIAVFVEPDKEIVEYVASMGVDAVEFHTKWYAKSYYTKNKTAELNKIVEAAEKARSLNLKVNLGHDLNLQNLPDIISKVKPDEVSIGHALMADALSYGLKHMVNEYRTVIAC